MEGRGEARAAFYMDMSDFIAGASVLAVVAASSQPQWRSSRAQKNGMDDWHPVRSRYVMCVSN